MKNKNMMLAGVVIFAIQIIALLVAGILLAYDAGSVIMVSNSTATIIIVATFLTLLNIAAIGFICYGASDE